jgi:GTPase SAR1 family protein
VYDCTNEESFRRVPLWVTEVRKYIEKEIPILIAGNKADLITEKRDQLKKDAELFAK